ncbi:MAG: hypothetical protein ACE5FT_06365 [Candidatus Nanoarchaeia archaeon]
MLGKYAVGVYTPVKGRLTFTCMHTLTDFSEAEKWEANVIPGLEGVDVHQVEGFPTGLIGVMGVKGRSIEQECTILEIIKFMTHL